MARLFVFLFLALPLVAQEPPSIAIAGLVHSHVWGHLERMSRPGPVRLVGVADPNPELQAEARKAGVPDALLFSDYKQMIEKTNPRIVWAFVENNRHLEIVEFCAPRKIHVMFEKPLAATYSEALAIRDLARKHGIQVLTNYQMAWWPTQAAAFEYAKSPEVGQIYRIRGVVGHGGPGSSGARSKYFFDWLTDPVKNGGGALMDFGCYNALWALLYLGRPDTVHANVLSLQPERFPKVEDHATLLLQYPKATALLEGSWDLPKSYQDLEIFGRSASIHVTQNELTIRKGNTTGIAAPRGLPPTLSDPVAYMADVVTKGKTVEGMTALDINADVIAIIDAAKESIRTGKPVKPAWR
jgi:predicted dehydrogenase